MKIEIGIPDRNQNDNIYIFRNRELVARKMFGKPWEFKAEACNHCGNCCKGYQKGLHLTGKDGMCKTLGTREDGTRWCSERIPIDCLVANPKPEDGCSVKWDC